MRKYLIAALAALTLASAAGAAWAQSCAWTTGGCGYVPHCTTYCNADGTQCQTYCN